MFDTMKIAKVIKEARIRKNMTQMNLADELGVSYQAVSNWERGNSMPDIAKLEDLCRALDITVNELLGMREQATAAVNKAVEQAELSVEELAEVAPMLPPEEVKKQVESKREAPEKKSLDLSAIAELAPFLDEEYLDELVMEAVDTDMDGLEDIAMYLSEETLEKLAERVTPKNIEQLVDSAPFLSEKALDTLVRKCTDLSCFENICDLAPFLSDETLDMLVDRVVESKEMADVFDLSDLYPFLSDEALHKIADRLMHDRNLDALQEIAPFI